MSVDAFDAVDTAVRRPWPIRAITWYQGAFSWRPSPCRFTPTCSNYALEAYETHGTGRGTWLTVRRLARCRPFGPSGWDPVPDTDHVDQRVDVGSHHHPVPDGEDQQGRRDLRDGHEHHDCRGGAH
jgi:putative membrane protein insertion efficiency factor